jgi:hypothetical protein
VFKPNIPKKRIEGALAEMDDIIDRSQKVTCEIAGSSRWWGSHLSGTVLDTEDAYPMWGIRVRASGSKKVRGREK